MPEFNPIAEIAASVVVQWQTWATEFEMLLTASDITGPKRQYALLLSQAGARIRELFLHIPDHGEENDYKTAKDKLTAYLQPQKNRSIKFTVFYRPLRMQRKPLVSFILVQGFYQRTMIF